MLKPVCPRSNAGVLPENLREIALRAESHRQCDLKIIVVSLGKKSAGRIDPEAYARDIAEKYGITYAQMKEE